MRMVRWDRGNGAWADDAATLSRACPAIAVKKAGTLATLASINTPSMAPRTARAKCLPGM